MENLTIRDHVFFVHDGAPQGASLSLGYPPPTALEKEGVFREPGPRKSRERNASDYIGGVVEGYQPIFAFRIFMELRDPNPLVRPQEFQPYLYRSDPQSYRQNQQHAADDYLQGLYGNLPK